LCNLVKHGVDFRRMAQLFDGPTVKVGDDRQDYGENRIHCLGETEGRVFAVAYAWPGANRRIITARQANARERKTYYARVKR
jgi:uncharacterized protein